MVFIHFNFKLIRSLCIELINKVNLDHDDVFISLIFVLAERCQLLKALTSLGHWHAFQWMDRLEMAEIPLWICRKAAGS